MNRGRVLCLVSLLLVAGCSSVPTKDIEVDAEADPKANFSGYTRYTWLGSAAILNDPYGKWEPPTFDADAEVKFLIDRELRKRGKLEDSVNPDLIVAFGAGIDMGVLELKTDPETKLSTLAHVPQGGLIVALIDSDTGFVIWVGVATADIKGPTDTEVAKARLDHAVTEMFRKLPK